MLSRRHFLYCSAAAGVIRAGAQMSSRERVDHALKGHAVDRPPFSFWHHFGLEKLPGDRQAEATLAFHRKFRTDLVKVMSDYPYPKPAGKWYELDPLPNPFPEQLRALELIRAGLNGEAYFVETIFNPWNVAEKLSSPKEVMELKERDPKALHAALHAIAESEANHAKKSIAAGAAGVFLAIANAQDGIMSREDYRKFSEPYDRVVLKAAAGAPLNVLHLHGDKVYLDAFTKGWPAAAINYSTHGTKVSVAKMRKNYSGLLMAGLDEVNYRKLSASELRDQWQSAADAAGRRFILTPGCSVPNDSADEELQRLPGVLYGGPPGRRPASTPA
jgi:uroporphyrinogen-III decarboxylase